MQSLDKWGYARLHYCARDGEADELKMWLGRGADPDVRDASG